MRFLLGFVVLVGGSLFLACGGDDDDGEATPTPTSEEIVASETEAATASPAEETDEPTAEPTAAPDIPVEVTLSEYEIAIDVDSGPAGTFAFALTNTGDEAHVFAVIETDVAADDLPTTSNGAFDSAGGAGSVFANTPSIRADASDAFRLDLEPGKYVFICNNVNPEGQGHYGLGMRAGFTVE